MIRIASRLKRLERLANPRQRDMTYFIDTPVRLCAGLLLGSHPELRHVEPDDCRDEDEYREMRLLLAQAVGNHHEAYEWRRRDWPTSESAALAELTILTQSVADEEPLVYERVEANIRHRRTAEGLA